MDKRAELLARLIKRRKKKNQTKTTKEGVGSGSGRIASTVTTSNPKPSVVVGNPRGVNTPAEILHKILPDMTLAKLSKDTGISYSMLTKVLNGHKNPSLKNAEKIAFHLGTTVDILIMELKRQVQIRQEEKENYYDAQVQGKRKGTGKTGSSREHSNGQSSADSQSA